MLFRELTGDENHGETSRIIGMANEPAKILDAQGPKIVDLAKLTFHLQTKKPALRKGQASKPQQTVYPLVLLFPAQCRTGPCKSRNLLADDWPIWSFVNIDLGPVCSIAQAHLCPRKDRPQPGTLERKHRNHDTGIGVDVKTISQFMKCFNGTNSGAVGVLAIDA